MRHMILPALIAAAALAPPGHAQSCGADMPAFVEGIRAEALALGLQPKSIDTFLQGAALDPKVLAADRKQGVFRKPFLDFAAMLISAERLTDAKAEQDKHRETLARAEADYGVPPAILLAFWAFETNFGRFQGDFNTRNALLTLAHDCRRPALFRPQLLAAIQLYELGDFPLDTTGAWAGEIGMVQMLPADIIARGVDGDGDGLILLKTSVPDALLSGANMLRHHGWRAEEPWLIEVTLPEDFDWAATGLATQRPLAEWRAMGAAPAHPAGMQFPPEQDGSAASVLLPQGRYGPAFLVFDNFRSLFEWNQSLTYVTTAGYFATRIQGAPPLLPRRPEPMLSLEEMQELQRKLTALGHDVGKIDGILGAGTRDAVQKEQRRLGLPADAWPTPALLEQL